MVLHTKYAMFLSDQPFIISTYFHKSTNIKFHVNPFSGRWVVLWGQRHGRTDWQKDDEANGCFSQFWTHTWPSYLVVYVFCFHFHTSRIIKCRQLLGTWNRSWEELYLWYSLKEENFHVLSKSRWRRIKFPYLTYVIKILEQGTYSK